MPRLGSRERPSIPAAGGTIGFDGWASAQATPSGHPRHKEARATLHLIQLPVATCISDRGDNGKTRWDSATRNLWKSGVCACGPRFAAKLGRQSAKSMSHANDRKWVWLRPKSLGWKYGVENNEQFTHAS